MENQNIQSVVQDAWDAFWSVVASRFPEAKTGDVAPDVAFELDQVAEMAVKHWIANNVPADGS